MAHQAGTLGSTIADQEAEAGERRQHDLQLGWLVTEEEGQGRKSSLRLASLNNVGSFWVIRGYL